MVLDLLVIEDHLDPIQDLRVLLVHQETKETLDLWVHLVLQGHQDHQGNRDLQDQLDQVELVDHQVQRARLADRDLWDNQALKEHQAFPDLLVHKDLQVPLAHRVLPVLTVMLVQLDLVDLQGRLVRLDRKEIKGHKDLKVVLVLEVLLDQLALPDLLVLLDQLVLQVTLDLQGLKVH